MMSNVTKWSVFQNPVTFYYPFSQAARVYEARYYPYALGSRTTGKYHDIYWMKPSLQLSSLRVLQCDVSRIKTDKRMFILH